MGDQLVLASRRRLAQPAPKQAYRTGRALANTLCAPHGTSVVDVSHHESPVCGRGAGWRDWIARLLSCKDHILIERRILRAGEKSNLDYVAVFRKQYSNRHPPERVGELRHGLLQRSNY